MGPTNPDSAFEELEISKWRRWEPDEHEKFIEAAHECGKDPERIAESLGTRNAQQVKMYMY